MPRKNLSTSYSPQSNDKPFEARKSLGQHFLRDTTALASIVSAAELSPKDVVLEVGPGEGVLTEALLKKTKKVVAIEKDHRLIEFLQERFKKEMEENRFSLIHEDILEVDLDSLSRSLGIKKGRYKVVANIPYYITGKLIRKFLTSDTHPSDMVLLLQKEVAERIVVRKKPLDSARGKESLLSLSVKAYGTPHYVKTIKKGAFSPPPKVDSALLKIEGISKKWLNTKKKERFFFELLHAGFGQKRKTLKKNLSPLFSKEILEKTFKEIGIAEKTRAEDLKLSEWFLLSQCLLRFRVPSAKGQK